jgi:hypothetical protein
MRADVGHHWRHAVELGKISFGLEFQAFAVVSTPLLLIPK